MSAELKQLRQGAMELAKKFRGAGQSDLADLLEVDARGFGVKAKIAHGRGLKTFVPQTTDQSKESRRESLPLRLKPIPFEIEIPTVSEEDYIKTREAVEATGAFIAPIRSITFEDLLAEDLNRPQRRFNHDWVNTSPAMQATLPPAMEVFIDPNAVRIEDSNSLPTDTQKQMIQDAGARFRERLPKAVRSFVVFDMMDPSTVSQLEDAWIDAGRGLLLPDYFVRTDVETVVGFVASVGRFDPTSRRRVTGWLRDDGHGHVFAVAVGVLPRKLIA